MLWLFKPSRLASIFSWYWSDGGIFPRGVQKQFHVWASRDEPVESWYSYTPQKVWTDFLAHAQSARVRGSHQYQHILWMRRSCDVLFKYVCFTLDPFVEWETADCVYLHPLYAHIPHTSVSWSVYLFIYLFFLSSRTHRLTDSYEFSYFAATAGLVLIWSRSSSISTTKLRRHSQQNSLQKRSTDSLVFIPKPWQNCTPPYSWPNYPGLL